MPTDSTAPNEVERRRQRLPDDHPAVERLRVLRAAVAKLQAVAAAARPEHTHELAAALAALDEAADGGAAPAGHR